MLFVSGRTGFEIFELAEEALDEVRIAIEERAESRDAFPVRHGLDVGLCSAFGEALA